MLIITTDYLAAAIIEKSKDPETGLIMDNTNLKLKQYYKKGLEILLDYLILKT